jgi:hypothetical protein
VNKGRAQKKWMTENVMGDGIGSRSSKQSNARGCENKAMAFATTMARTTNCSILS